MGPLSPTFCQWDELAQSHLAKVEEPGPRLSCSSTYSFAFSILYEIFQIYQNMNNNYYHCLITSVAIGIIPFASGHELLHCTVCFQH